MNSDIMNNIEQIKTLNSLTILELNGQIKKSENNSNLLKCRAVLLEIRNKLRHAEIYASLD